MSMGIRRRINWINVFISRCSLLFQYQFPIRTSTLTRSVVALYALPLGVVDASARTKMEA